MNPIDISDVQLRQIGSSQSSAHYISGYGRKSLEGKKNALGSLGALCTFGNVNAYYFLLDKLYAIGFPEDIAAVHEKMTILAQAAMFPEPAELIDFTAKELAGFPQP